MAKSGEARFLRQEVGRGYALRFDETSKRVALYALKKRLKSNQDCSASESVQWSAEVSDNRATFSEIASDGQRKAAAEMATLVCTVMSVLIAAQQKEDQQRVRFQTVGHRHRCVMGQRLTVGLSVAAFVLTLVTCGVLQGVVSEISSTPLWVAAAAVAVGVVAAGILTWFHLADRKSKTPKERPLRLFNKQNPMRVQTALTVFAEKHIAAISYNLKSLGKSR